jgi:hypothetical protein
VRLGCQRCWVVDIVRGATKVHSRGETIWDRRCLGGANFCGQWVLRD